MTIPHKPVCLITGAAGRLGSALCAHLAPSHHVIAVYRTQFPPIDSQITRCVTGLTQAAHEELVPVSAHCIQADLGAPADIRRVAEVALALHGGVDSIVHCAADLRFHGRVSEFWESGDAALEQLRLNAIAPAQLTSALFQASWKHTPDLNARRNRSIVNVSSISGLTVTGDHGQGAYSASKAALNTFSLFLALELAPYSVRVNALCPGRFATPAATSAVVSAVCDLLENSETGSIVVPESEANV